MLHWHDGVTPAVVPAGRRYLGPSTRRAATGAHYTPRALAEEVVVGALEPLVKRPGPLETADRSRWQLRPSSAITQLRVADIAMGSGAFLVAACRYLADRLVEAWAAEGRHDAVRYAARAADGPVASSDVEVDEVLLAARREIAEHCLYGVDINPLAVEMAKLSLWLITMDARRPFGFLDDRLICGDSLLGVSSIEQLQLLHLDPVAGRRLQGDRYQQYDALLMDWTNRLQRAADLRRQITAAPATTARDIEHKLRLLAQAHEQTAEVSAVADRLTGLGLQVAGSPSKAVDLAFTRLQIEIGYDGHGSDRQAVDQQIQAGQPAGKAPRKPLHWPVAFPEVFVDPTDTGFDAIVGNPPFMSGKKISGPLGSDYLAWLVRWDGQCVKGSADLVARFVLRANTLLTTRGQLGLVATNAVLAGDTFDVALGRTEELGLAMRAGTSSRRWPSKSADVDIVDIWASRAPLSALSQRLLDGEDVPSLGGDLQPITRVKGRPRPLLENRHMCFIGSYVLGLGFILTPEQAASLIANNHVNVQVLRPYILGKDLTSRVDHSAGRWVIDFGGRSLSEAQEYPDVLQIIDDLVRPSRETKSRATYRQHWWQFAESVPGLYTAIEGLGFVLVINLSNKLILPVRVPTGPVFAHKCAVFATGEFADLAILSSSSHFVWAARYTSPRGSGLNYSPTDVFASLARPPSTARLAELGSGST